MVCFIIVYKFDYTSQNYNFAWFFFCNTIIIVIAATYEGIAIITIDTSGIIEFIVYSLSCGMCKMCLNC